MPKSLYSLEHEQLARLLRSLRVRADLTQTELAARLDHPQSYVSKYEAGQRRLDLVELRALGEALGISLTRIVQEFDDALGGG